MWLHLVYHFLWCFSTLSSWGIWAPVFLQFNGTWTLAVLPPCDFLSLLPHSDESWLNYGSHRKVLTILSCAILDVYEHFSRVFGLLASLLSTSLCRLNVPWDRQDAYLVTPLSPVPKCTDLPIFLRYAAFLKMIKWYSILDPKYSYNLHRSTINPQTELDVFVIESLWNFPLRYTSFLYLPRDRRVVFPLWCFLSSVNLSG